MSTEQQPVAIEQDATPAATHEPDLIIITGMSGAGRTEALHTFEDFGYFCIDNLPPRLMMNLVSLAATPGQSDPNRRLAVVCDARNRNFTSELREELHHVHEAGFKYRIIFLDADDGVIVSRYKASRRRHPLCEDGRMTIAQGIRRERELLSEIREMANAVINTSYMKPIALRKRLRDLFSTEMEHSGLSVSVYSFGFKHGAPTDADIVIDVRFLPNPFYEPELRPLNGLDAPVRDFVLDCDETQEFLARWKALLECVMPGYVAEGKQQLAIGVGCTGGQHRSVALAEQTGAMLAAMGYDVYVSHRDMALANPLSVKED